MYQIFMHVLFVSIFRNLIAIVSEKLYYQSVVETNGRRHVFYIKRKFRQIEYDMAIIFGPKRQHLEGEICWKVKHICVVIFTLFWLRELFLFFFVVQLKDAIYFLQRFNWFCSQISRYLVFSKLISNVFLFFTAFQSAVVFQINMPSVIFVLFCR